MPKKTILVVEDDEGLQEILKKQLQEEGFATLGASDGQEGLDQALRQKPALILLDIVLPGIDGLEMLNKLRGSNSYGQTVPVILLTNLNADTDRIMQSVTREHPSYYLVKADFTPKDVIEKVREVLKM